MLSSFLDGAQIVWYCLAPFGIFYNYWLDFIHDWDISDSFSEMKRESVIIHKKGFMIFRIGYLFLRIGWLLNISPNITYYISTELWLLITVGLIELVRRLLWNVLRVEKEHLINCRLFRVKNDNTKK